MPPKKAYESYESESDGDSEQKKGKKQKLEKGSDEYRCKRERNNVAVRKSREASRQKAKVTMERVSKLRDENKALEQKVTILNKELGVLRDLFLTHASASGDAPSNTASNNNNSSGNASSASTDHLSEQDSNSNTNTQTAISTVDLEPEYFVQDHHYFVTKEEGR